MIDPDIASIIKLVLIFIGIMVGLFGKNKLSKTVEAFWVYLLISFGLELLEFQMMLVYKHNYPIYHIGRPLLYSIFTLCIYKEMGKVGKFFYYSLPTVWLLAYLNTTYLQPIETNLNTLIIILLSALTIIQCLIYIAILFEEEDWKLIKTRHAFWIIIGMLIYTIISFLTLGIYNTFLQLKMSKPTFIVMVLSEWFFYSCFLLNFIIQVIPQNRNERTSGS